MSTSSPLPAFDPNRPYPPDPFAHLPAVPAITLVSSEFANGERLPSSASADGGGLSPQLSWSGFPPETKSFAVSCFDPDAPRPGGFWHWLVVNIPPTVTELPQGVGTDGNPPLPVGAYVVENPGLPTTYLGAHPPEGDHEHRYFFAVHALDVPTVSLDAGASPAHNLDKLLPHTIARGELVGTYQR